jgi:hypothetical protein
LNPQDNTTHIRTCGRLASIGVNSRSDSGFSSQVESNFRIAGQPATISICILSEVRRQTSQVNARIAEATTGQANRVQFRNRVSGLTLKPVPKGSWYAPGTRFGTNIWDCGDPDFRALRFRPKTYRFRDWREFSQNTRFQGTQAKYQRGIVMKDWGIALWMAALASFFLWSALDDRRRARSIAALASRLGLKSWGNQLPPDLSLSETPMAHASATWNVIEGAQNGVPFIVFDCRIGTGKASWRRTVIAARSSRDVFATVPSESSYTVDRSGEWMVFYSPKEVSFFGRRLMPVAELEARISTLG